MELIVKGRKVLTKDYVIWRLWRIYGDFFKILRRGKYSKETDLFFILENWVKRGKFERISGDRFNINVGVFRLHRSYPRGIVERKGFGDVAFISAFSTKYNKRVVYANFFQLKVKETAIKAYRELSNPISANQLDLYRKDLILTLNKTLGAYNHLICDFLYYWLIGSKKIPHPIIEIPISYTWISSPGKKPIILSGHYLQEMGPYTGMDTMLKSLFLVTGVNIKLILKFSTLSLRRKLIDILQYGVQENSIEDDGHFERQEKVEKGSLIASSFMIATDVIFR